VSFAAGALLPLLPYLFGSPHALPVAVVISGMALCGVGALLSLFTGRNALHSGLRMLALGVLAGGVTHAIGRLLGATL
jgi:VIT1/CCC1 family predicted Fe2+/Mn2+ transporter